MISTKKITLIIGFLLASFANLYASDNKPSYFATHDPSPDSVMQDCNVLIENGTYTISLVDTVDAEAKALDIYLRAKEWLGVTYDKPDSIITSDVEGTQIIFKTLIAKNLSGRVVLTFRNGRYKLIISNIMRYIPPKYAKFTKPASVEQMPRYSMENGDRAKKWLLADCYEFLSSIRSKMDSPYSDKNNDW